MEGEVWADELRAKVCGGGGVKGEVWVEEEGDGSAAGIFGGQTGTAHLLQPQEAEASLLLATRMP